MIHIALASNSNYFDGLAATLLSLLCSNRRNIFGLHIIDGGLSARQKRFLTRRTAGFNPQNRISFHTIGSELFRGFRTDYGNSYMTYARIVIGSVVPTDRVIYLDTDLLVAADILPLWQTDLAGNVAAAAPDAGLPFLRDDYPFEDDCGAERYFNAGVMVIDLRRWRELQVQERLLRMITEAPTKFKWWDQTAMNAIFRRQIVFVDPRWNTFADALDVRRPTDGSIFHFVGPTKPWQRGLEIPAYRVWRSFYAYHVRSQWTLCHNLNFTRSLLQEKRHFVLARLGLLRWFAGFVLKARSAVIRRTDEVSLARFEAREADAVAAFTSAEIDAFVRQRWGPPGDSHRSLLTTIALPCF